MTEVGATYHPKPLTDIESVPFAEHLAALTRVANGHWITGMALTYDGVTAHIAPGRAIVLTDADPIAAYHVTLGSQVDKALTPSATNYLYLDVQANVIKNTTGITPADSIPLYVIVVGASTVTSSTDVRSSVVEMLVALKAQGLDLASNELTNLGAPTANGSAARYQDVLDAIAGVGGIKTPARAATTGALTLSGLQTVDGVVLASQDRVLVKNQASGATNGLYVALSGAWTRTTDFDSAGDIKGGTLIPISEGTVNGGSVYGMDTDDPVVVGTTVLTFTRKDVQAHEALTTAHGAVSAATPSTMVVRDSAGRAKYAAGAASGDALIYGQTASGDLTGTFPGPTLVLNTVDDTKLRQGAALSVIGRSANSLGNVADIAAATDGFVLRRSGTTIGFGQIGTSSYVVNSVDNTVIRDSGALSVIGRSANTSGDPADISATASTLQVLRVSGTTLGFGTIDHTYISDFDTQVRTSRLDQMAAPTASVSMNSQKITNLLAPVAASDAARLDTVTARSPTYAEVDATAEAATGDIIAQGAAVLHVVGSSGAQISSMPGLFAYSWQGTPLTTSAVAVAGTVGSSTGGTSPTTVGSIAPGYSYSLKGVLKSTNGTKLESALEKFAIGVFVTSTTAEFGSATITGDFGNATEGTRDDETTVAVVVDGSNNIQSYNCAAAGDASYTDSTFDADLTIATPFEIIVSCPSTYDSINDLAITIKLGDNGSTLRTILNAVAPVGTESTTVGVHVAFLVNTRIVLSKLTYKVAKVA